MISISKPMQAGQATSYFDRDDYYLQEGGVWLGKGAQSLGLSGEVEMDAFVAVASGLHPDSGELLVPAHKQHRAGIDITFSPPKSVSIAALTDPSHKDLHDKAVAAVVDYLERNYAQSRVMEDGETRVVNTGNLVISKFDHMTNRELDPQLHSHLFISNLTQRLDGEWRALHNDSIYKAQKLFGRIYDNELMHLYRKHGYEVEITNREKGNWELSSIPKELINEFSTRRQQVEERFSEIKDSGKYANASDARLYEIAALDTRKIKPRHIQKEFLKEQWESDFTRHGYSIESIKDRLEATRSQEPLKHGIGEGADIPLMQAADVLHSRESAFSKVGLLQTAMILSHGEHSLEDFETAFVNISQSKDGVLSLGTKIDHGVEVERWTTTKMLDIERGVIERAEDGRRGFKPVAAKGEVEAFLKEKEGQKTQELIIEGKLKEGENWQLTNDQKRYVLATLCSQDNVLLVEGDPGTGKTAAREMIEAFNSEVLAPSGRRQHISLNVATMGRAASEIASATGGLASTIDRFLSNKFEMADPANFWDLALEGRKAHYLPKDAVLEILVDEASTVTSLHFSQIMDLARRWRQEFQTDVKITLSGDRKQMPAIGAGRLFEELLDKTSTCRVRLKKIIRQNEGTFAHQVATALNHDRDSTKALKILQENDRLVEIPDREGLIDATVSKYLEVCKDGKRAFVIAAHHQDRKELNEQIRAALVREGKIEEGSGYHILSGVSNVGIKSISAENYTPGQVVVFSGKGVKNWGIRYGSEGVIEAVDPDKNNVTVTYSSGKERVRVVHDLKRDWDKLSIFEPEIRHFSAGDKVIFGRNNRSLGVDNGDLGEILSIEDKGKIIVRLERGHLVTLRTAGRKAYRYLDHAYTITVRKSQGATTDEAIGFFHVRPSITNTQKALQLALGVEMTKSTFRELNTTRSLQESEWNEEGSINGHQVFVAVGIAEIGHEKTELSKVVEIKFRNPRAVIADAEARKTMGEAGIFYAGDGYWRASITNRAARDMIGQAHPLNDPKFVQVLRERVQDRQSAAKASSEPTCDARNVGDAERRFGEMYFQTFNVMDTRGRAGFTAMTNDVERLSSDVQRWLTKESTLVEPHLKVKKEGESQLGKVADYDEKTERVAVEYNSRKGGKSVKQYHVDDLRDSGGRELFMTSQERVAAGGRRNRLFGLGGVSLDLNLDSGKLQMVETMKYGDGQFEKIKVDSAEIDSFVKKDSGTYRASRTIKRKDGTKIKEQEHGISFAGQLFGYRWRSEVIKNGEHKGERKISTLYHFGRKYWGTTTYMNWIGDKHIEKWEGKMKGGILTPKQLVITRVQEKEGMTIRRRAMGVLQRRMEELAKVLERISDNMLDKIEPAKLSQQEALDLMKPGKFMRFLMSAEEKHLMDNAYKAAAARIQQQQNKGSEAEKAPVHEPLQISR